MKYGIFAAVSALALAACGSSSDSVEADADGDGEITKEESVAAMKKSAEQVKPQPGKYKVSMEFVSAEGMPEELQGMMGKSMNQSMERCMTQEEADRGFGQPPEDLDDEACKMDKYTLSDGELEMAVSCKGEGEQGNMQMTAKGSVSPTEQDLTVTTTGNMGPMGEATVTMKMKQERIGDCDE